MESDQTQMLIDYLRERDVPCPRCGYNLRDAAMPRCSECGLPIELSVRSPVPISGYWVATMVFVGADALMGIFFLCLVLQRGFPDAGWNAAGNLTVLSYIALIPAALLLYWARRLVIRQPTAVQRGLAISAGLIPVILLLGLIFWVR